MDRPVLQVKELGIECAEPLQGHEASPDSRPAGTLSAGDGAAGPHRTGGARWRITPRAATSSTRVRSVRLVVAGMEEKPGHSTIVE